MYMQDFLKEKIKLTASLCLALVVVSFALYRSYDVLFGSRLKVSFTTGGELLSLSGNATHAREVTINGRSTAINVDGTFSENIALLPGYNIVSVHSVNKFGKERTEVFATYQKETSPVAQNDSNVLARITNTN